MRPQCDSIVDMYGDHLLHCEWGIQIIRQNGAQVRLLKAEQTKATSHPAFEPRRFVRHKERSNISALGSHGGSDMFHITFGHPLSPARVQDGVESAMNNSRRHGMGT